MKPTCILAGLAAALAIVASPAAAYPIATTGRTLATPQLAADVLRTIAAYSKANGGCSFIFSANMKPIAGGYEPVKTALNATARGGHYELWTLNACAAKQIFQVGMWPSPRGGSDYAVVPLTGRMPLHTR